MQQFPYFMLVLKKLRFMKIWHFFQYNICYGITKNVICTSPSIVLDSKNTMIIATLVIRCATIGHLWLPPPPPPPPLRTTKLWYWVHSVRPSVSPSVRPACHVRSVLCTLLDGLFPYWTQMITSMRGCATHNDLWPWPIFSRSFRHDFATKLLKYGTSCGVHFTACTLLDGFFPLEINLGTLYKYLWISNRFLWVTFVTKINAVRWN